MPLQEKAYLDYKFNEHLIPLAKEFNLPGMPVKKEYNGREADTLIAEAKFFASNSAYDAGDSLLNRHLISFMSLP